MKRTILQLCFLVFAVTLLSSCDKEQWKETVTTEFTGEAINTTVNFGANELVIDTIIINIESTTLNGNRIQAESINLSNTLNEEFLFTSGNTTHICSYAIPQGTYETFQLTTKVGSSNASIIVKGNYNSPSGNNKKVLLELDYNEYLLSEMAGGSNTPVSIDTQNPGSIVLHFDGDKLFENLNPSMWNSANTSNIGGENGVFVSNGTNQNLYNQITPKISQSIQLSYE